MATPYDHLASVFGQVRQVIPPERLFNASVQEVDEEIQKLRSLCTAFQSAVEAQISKYNHLRNLLTSPILRLPNELISEIFILVIESTHEKQRYKELRSLQLVCNRFHQVSEATPSLWSFIDVPTSKDPLPMTQILLQKSRDAPLDIYLHATFHRENDILRLFDLVFPHCHRWRTFICDYMCLAPVLPSFLSTDWVAEFTQYMEQLTQLHTPQLRKFSVEGGKRPGTPRFNLKFHRNFAPRLQHLDMDSITIPWDSTLLSRLTYLRVRARDVDRALMRDQYLQVLSTCPKLEEIYLLGLNDIRTEDGSAAAAVQSCVQLPKLRTLFLDCLHPTIVTSLLSSIQASPSHIVILFSPTLSSMCETVLQTTLLAPDAFQFLPKFWSEPHTFGLVPHDFDGGDKYGAFYTFRDIATFHLVVDDGRRSYRLDCGFHGFYNLGALYHTLILPPARTTIHTLILEIGGYHLGGATGLRRVYSELSELREIQLVYLDNNPWDVLAPLKSPTFTYGDLVRRETWLCPHLRTLKFKSIILDIEKLWEFLSRRFDPQAHVPSPSRISHLEVTSISPEDASLDSIPKETVSRVVGLLGEDILVWDNHKFDPTTREWKICGA